MLALVLEIAGAVAISVGAALLAPAAGLIVAGAFALAFGIALDGE